MNEEANAGIQTLLASVALEAAGNDTAVATFILIDSALAILVSSVRETDGRAVSVGILAEYISTQIALATVLEGVA